MTTCFPTKIVDLLLDVVKSRLDGRGSVEQESLVDVDCGLPAVVRPYLREELLHTDVLERRRVAVRVLLRHGAVAQGDKATRRPLQARVCCFRSLHSQ